ncbi:MAG: sucrose synthase [Ignavibacteria bacterium]|nr:sucrose synthase [Ignavibacteria bacterium]MBT8381097.1 sucrose synthase [Ignavibacteria bacterium]MBT8392133.1 sucrose synthase [Ignavibacteria bacterium]NNJ53533.1 sucrose synthase [Ignavibacteriaceae bacterium]NNL20460.1 sucrose synthase [Ignavibacteriaceae bacterium]
MSKRLEEILTNSKKPFFGYLKKVCAHSRKLLVKGDLLEIFEELHKKNNNSGNIESIKEIVNKFTESVCLDCSVYVEMRETIGKSEYYLFNVERSKSEKIHVIRYLKAKERYRHPLIENDLLTLNFSTFYDKFPSVRESKSIGKGVEYLNRYLSSTMFTQPQKLSQALFDFLFVHKKNSQQLIVNSKINNPEKLSSAIDKAILFLKKMEDNLPYSQIKNELSGMGFEAGLGNTAGEILSSLDQLDSLLTSPDHLALKEFLSKIPMIYNIVIVSPHGYFGQEGVLGKPDTGGQVVYILDQVKALEKEMIDSLKHAGIHAKPKIIILTRLIPNAEDTKCNVRLEKVYDTENVWILRVPFKNDKNMIAENWTSRFEVWPYLERYADDSYKELLEEFGTRPDLVIGNYSDGNLVATILANKFGVTQCNVAHALEKSKYLYSGLYWDEMEKQYHFSTQFTADLLSMNAADFIITSTYQEIAGREDSIGQYESYVNFTMPGLYRVAGGINIFHPKFNILPPGVNTNIFFPFSEIERRDKKVTEEIHKKIFNGSVEGIGKLKNPKLPAIFSMARLDKIKNLTSLVKWYGENEELRELANLIVVAGKINTEESFDNEEKEQIELMHKYIKEFKLNDNLRWLPGDADRKRVPEYYRVIADQKGVFVQPASFEGFGLTVIEAMRSGLPTFATQYGGPLEIIEDEKSGFHINPVDDAAAAQKLIEFFKKCKKDKNYWGKISNAGIKRVDTAFNWELYAKNLLSLAKIYGFWKYTTNLEMTEMNTYLDLMYNTLYKHRAATLKPKVL